MVKLTFGGVLFFSYTFFINIGKTTDLILKKHYNYSEEITCFFMAQGEQMYSVSFDIAIYHTLG